MEIKKDILWRVAVIYILMVSFAAVIFGRVVYLQVAEKKQWTQRADSLTQKDIIIEPNRGDICAIDGRLLSSSVPYYEIRMDMGGTGLTDDIFYKNVDSLATCLSRLFGDQPTKEYKRDLVGARRNGDRFHLVKRKVSYLQMAKMRQFPIFRHGKNSGGFICIQSDKRVKPFSDLASRTIGFLGENSTGAKEGKVGIEGAFNTELKGIQGVRLMQKLSGNVWMPLNGGSEVEPKDGMDVISTIDVNIQDVAESALLNQLKSHGAHHGCAILMEVETGEVKAIANLERDSSGGYHESYNYAIGAATEPGSTFKLASLLVAMEDGYVNLNDSVEIDYGKAKYYDREMKDSHESPRKRISVKEAFWFSSNVGISKIITKYYWHGKEQQFVDRLYKMNLNEKLGLDIKGEAPPYIKSPGDSVWYGTTLPWMSIGYEVKLTPIQLLTFYNAIANNGKMVKPRFVKSLRFHGNIVKTFEPEIINPSICSKETVAKAKKLMEGVVDVGTARNLKLKNYIYKIAGKTGTAQIANKKFGYKNKDGISYQASFIGYFPADNPKYSCIVVVNAPSNEVYYGNVVAGPIFKEIADKVYATSIDIHKEVGPDSTRVVKLTPAVKCGYKDEVSQVINSLNIPLQNATVTAKWIVPVLNDSVIQYQNRVVKEHIVPNVKGMGARDALYILENAGLSVILVGKGAVVNQSLEPGAPLRRGENIVIELG